MQDADREVNPDATARRNWLREPDPSRPIYVCGQCGEQAMQFYAAVPWNEERAEAFACCACGSCWGVHDGDGQRSKQSPSGGARHRN